MYYGIIWIGIGLDLIEVFWNLKSKNYVEEEDIPLFPKQDVH
jgi:hypothetical protein